MARLLRRRAPRNDPVMAYAGAIDSGGLDIALVMPGAGGYSAMDSVKHDVERGSQTGHWASDPGRPVFVG